MNREEDSLLLELYYLPIIPVFCLIKSRQQVSILADENYQKQTYRNRTPVLTANGVHFLTIPVKHGEKKITEVEIDYHQQWVKNHIRTIISAYTHSPFFEYYFPYFEDIYNLKRTHLFSLNYELFCLCLKILKLSPKLILTDNFDHKADQNHIVQIFPDKSQQSKAAISIPYRQVFGEKFIPELSILDLIFNMGPDSIKYL